MKKLTVILLLTAGGILISLSQRKKRKAIHPHPDTLQPFELSKYKRGVVRKIA
jgi:hypothetical protein